MKIEVIEEILQQWETEKIEQNTGASTDSLIALEHSIGFLFPEDFKALYSHVNGFKDYEWKVNMFSVWSLERILNEYNDCDDKNFIGFSDFLINSHHIGFHKTQAGIFKSYSANEYTWISDSFLHAIQLINTNADLIF